MAMDASDVSITAIKIDIQSTNGVQAPWSECVTAINLDTPGTITIDDTDPYAIIYTITATDYRELEISSDCKILFEEFDTIRWFWSASSSSVVLLEFVDGSECVVEEGFTFDLGYTGTYRRGYIYIYGKLTLNGTTDNHIIFKHYRNFYFKARADQYWRYVDFADVWYSGGYNIYFSYDMISTEPIIDIKYVEVYNIEHTNYGSFFIQQQGLKGNIIFDNWYIHDMNYGLYITQSTTKFVDCTFENHTIQPLLYDCGNNIGRELQTERNANTTNQQSFQPFLTFENCLFKDLDNPNYMAYIYYGSNVYYKECTFERTGTPTGVWGGPIISNNGTAVFNDCTFTNLSSNKLIWGGACLDGREVAITVKDLSNEPIEDASITILQSEGKEKWIGKTDENGQLLNIHGDNPVLIEREEYTLGVYIDWSNSEVGGQYHSITVSKDGYSTETINIEVTEDKDITINLTPIAKTNTVIHNSTIINSTIY